MSGRPCLPEPGFHKPPSLSAPPEAIRFRTGPGPQPGRRSNPLSVAEATPYRLPIVLVRVVEEDDVPLVRQVLQAQDY